ncbi:MAG: hypothetical protein JWM76_2247 [Pseudonocardiales bacterium]|nr:hypothetical protein [Pseudonocardiales bacterium]
MTNAKTQIRFTGDKDEQGRWVAAKTDGATDTGVALYFSALSDAVSLAEAEGWTGGVSLSGTTYEAMLENGAADPEGSLGANVTRTD